MGVPRDAHAGVHRVAWTPAEDLRGERRSFRADRRGPQCGRAACVCLVPPLLGMSALVLHPGLSNRELALPTLLIHDVPFWVGGLGLAAVFSAEVSAADAILFMLATSLSQDLYKRFVSPSATDRQVLMVARDWRRSLAARSASAIALVSETIIDALSVFYTLLSVSLFVPIVAGLFMRAPASARRPRRHRRRRHGGDRRATVEWRPRRSACSRRPCAVWRLPRWRLRSRPASCHTRAPRRRRGPAVT